MGPLALSLMLLVALAAFVALAVRKLAILRHLEPSARLDDVPSRLRTVLVNGFLQRRMIRGDAKAGVMHAAIFAGFLILLVRKLHLVALGYDEQATLPGAFAAAKDFVELAVLAACGYAFHRRLVTKPRRLEPNREALVVLNIRMPRLLLGALVGAALAVSGALMQGLFRNPLADPGLVGVSAGAGLAAGATIVLGDRFL